MNANVDRLHTLPSKQSTDQEQERVPMNLLSAWNFNRIEVPDNGDCLFASVITYLRNVDCSANKHSS